MPPDTRILDIATSLLDNLVAGLTDEGIDVPSRQYIHSGEIAYDFVDDDCSEAFVVSFQGILQGTGATTAAYIPGTPIKCAVPLVAQYIVVLLRCVPVITDDGPPPTPADLTAAAQEILTDSMTLPNVAINKDLQGALTEQMCNLKGMGDVVAIGPNGGIGGTQLTLYVELA